MPTNRATPSTKADLANFKLELITRFESSEHRLQRFLLGMEARIITSNDRLAESMQQRIKQGEGK